MTVRYVIHNQHFYTRMGGKNLQLIPIVVFIIKTCRQLLQSKLISLLIPSPSLDFPFWLQFTSLSNSAVNSLSFYHPKEGTSHPFQKQHLLPQITLKHTAVKTIRVIFLASLLFQNKQTFHEYVNCFVSGKDKYDVVVPQTKRNNCFKNVCILYISSILCSFYMFQVLQIMRSG